MTRTFLYTHTKCHLGLNEAFYCFVISKKINDYLYPRKTFKLRQNIFRLDVLSPNEKSIKNQFYIFIILSSIPHLYINEIPLNFIYRIILNRNPFTRIIILKSEYRIVNSSNILSLCSGQINRTKLINLIQNNRISFEMFCYMFFPVTNVFIVHNVYRNMIHREVDPSTYMVIWLNSRRSIKLGNTLDGNYPK